MAINSNTSSFLLMFCCLVIIYPHGTDAYTEIQRKAIRLLLDPIGVSCANATGVTPEQVEAAKSSRDVNDIPPCFFLCFLRKPLFIKTVGGKEILDVVTVDIFAQFFIPSVNFNLPPIIAEITECATEFANTTQVDNYPTDCPKTSVLVNCLAKKPALINAIVLESRSLI